MKRQVLLSFITMLGMLLIMRWQGAALVSPATPRGILELEFAGTAERLQQLQATWQWSSVRANTLLDFIFILAYVYFFVVACRFIKDVHDWTCRGRLFILLSLIAGSLDVIENILMLLVYTDKMDALALSIIYYAATIKFILVGCILLYLLISIPVLMKKKRANAKV